VFELARSLGTPSSCGCGCARVEGNDKKASGRGDAVRLPTRGRLRRVSASLGKARMQDGRLRSDELRRAGNATDPRAGCGMEQAHSLYPEKAVEVVRNHKDGT
jgi:hypothetical protein